jgi:galactokinase
MNDTEKSRLVSAPSRASSERASEGAQSMQESAGERSNHVLRERFIRLFAGSPQIYRAPGRINLIGEHTDYNEGFVMPAAVGMYTWAAISPRTDRKLLVYSENFSEQVELDLDRLPATAAGHWSDYITGVTKMLLLAGRQLKGANLLLLGEVPFGAGLSSSASLEIVTGYALLEVAGLEADRTSLALLSQRAENEFVGARCGIMDQFISSHGEKGQAILLDCRSLQYRLLPLSEDVRLVICNTTVRHSIASGEYNQRCSECEESVRILASHLPNVRALRDVTLRNLNALQDKLPATLFRRSRHIITENSRVQDAAAALERNDMRAFGKLVGESHQSLRDDFEVSCAELDLMVSLAYQAEGVYGARMTGGGFGGCTINLVDPRHVDSFKANVAEAYERSTRRKPEIYVCSAAEGVGPV